MDDRYSYAGMRVHVRAEGDNGRIVEEHWKDGIGGALDNPDGPASLNISSKGVVLEEEYYRDGKLHRLSGPAKITRRIDGSVEQETWFKAGCLHRGDGPACISRDLYGNVSSESFWRNGVRVEPNKGKAR